MGGMRFFLIVSREGVRVRFRTDLVSVIGFRSITIPLGGVKTSEKQCGSMSSIVLITLCGDTDHIDLRVDQGRVATVKGKRGKG